MEDAAAKLAAAGVGEVTMEKLRRAVALPLVTPCRGFSCLQKREDRWD
jgi:hypothetical protein